MMHKNQPLIVNFTPTGMVPTKENTPYVPITTQEIIEQVHEANSLGITLVHLHAREEKTGEPTWKSTVYSRIFEGIRKHCPDLVICASLSGRNFNEFEKRSEVLSLQPDMGSLTLSSLNFPKQASVNAPEMIQNLAQAMLNLGIKPELEVFDFGMLHYLNFLVGKNLLKPPFYVNIIVGNISGLQANMCELGLALQLLPQGAIWALGGIGHQQLTANTMAIANNGGVRIGLEDNLYFDKNRQILATNLQLIQRIHDLSAIFERPIMKPTEFGALGFYNANRTF
jgi:3-keto-5-aminohexanoate cleavage enzyme